MAVALAIAVAAVTGAMAQAERLPDGDTARAGSGDIVAAWYVAPTNRYGHGVLGDSIEAGGLAVETADGTTLRLMLPQTQVFEDITPRIVDLDRDGRNEIVTIRASLTDGAALAVYGMRDGGLSLVAETPEIGQRNRWLNPAGVLDVDGDGVDEIALVKTPHIGGILEIWSFTGETLVKRLDHAGVSNHAIGSRALNLSALLDIDGDARPELILPDQPRTRLLALDITPWRVRVVGAAALPDEIGEIVEVSASHLDVRLRGGGNVRLRVADFR